MTIAVSCGTSASRRRRACCARWGARWTIPVALALELSQLEVARWRKFLPPVASRARLRASGSISTLPRASFGSTLVWSVRLEDGSRRDGATSTADCPEIWRGEVEGSWITRRRFDLPIDLPTGYHELEVKVAGGTAPPLPADHLAAAVL